MLQLNRAPSQAPVSWQLFPCIDRSARFKLGSFVLALGLAAFANAQERNVTASYRDADVRTVIQQLGEITKTNVLIEDGVEGTVTFLSNGPMTADEFRSAVVALLADLGYQVSERDGVLFIGPKRQ